MASTKLILQNGFNHASKVDIEKQHLLQNGKVNGLTNGAANGVNGYGAVQTNGCNGQPSSSSETQQQQEQYNNSKSYRALVEVRKRFLEYAEQNPDKVNERDKIKLATDDWYLKRYLLARNRRVNDTMDMLRKTMEWRNEFGVHISEDAMFPMEFYKIGGLFPYEKDRKGNIILYLRIKYHRKITEMLEVEKHFLVHTFEKIDRITNGQGLVILFDCDGAGYSNCDMEFLQFLITCATEYAPVGLQYIIVYKLPWLLNSFWSLARKLLPAYLANRVRFCDEKSITEFVAPENLPDFMGGICRRNYRWIPPGCPSVFKLAHAHGITDAEINRILPQFQAFLDEADEALNNNNYEDPPDEIAKYVNNPVTAPTLLSDLALCSIGLGDGSLAASLEATQNLETRSQRKASEARARVRDASGIIRLFPEEFIEFNYDAYNDAFHATVTLFNPNEKNSVAFKLMSNRPSNYSVKPARGVLAPGTMLTLSIVLLNEHKSNDKFLIIAQPLEGEVRSITKDQFDALWSPKVVSGNNNTQQVTTTHTTIRLGSYVKNKVIASPALQATVKNPQLYELVTTCRSLKRRQTLSIMINILLLIIIVNLLFFN